MNIIFALIIILQGFWNLKLAYSFLKKFGIKKLTSTQKNMWYRNIIGACFSSALGAFILYKLINSSHFTFFPESDYVGMSAIFLIGLFFWFEGKYYLTLDDSADLASNFQFFYKKSSLTTAYILFGGCFIALVINILHKFL